MGSVPDPVPVRRIRTGVVSMAAERTSPLPVGLTAVDEVARARAFAEPLIALDRQETGESALAHADGVAAILAANGASSSMQAAAYLVDACAHLSRPREAIARAFGDGQAGLAVETNLLIRVQRQARQASEAAHLANDPKARTETVRKMLLAFSRDLRVVLLRLASRLQTLRYCAAQRLPVPSALASESLDVFAPLANRLGIWQLKWEIEDLAFRFLEPQTYREIAALLDAKRAQREADIEQLRADLQASLRAQGLDADVHGRPKHIYSIVRKMRGKSLAFSEVLDVRALRVIVPQVRDCYAALAWVHAHFAPVPQEFDDYIARPKPNGYQSLHTVVRDTGGLPVEVQIRTQAMHEHAEHGVAAHWAYKEAGVKGYAGVSAAGAYDAKVAVLRQLLAWQRDLTGGEGELFDDRIYVLTPEAAVIELPQGATPVDFAYAVHTNLGHRCRGARVDGNLVPLNTPLRNGQTVEVIAAKEGGPSRDWLVAEQGFLVSHRGRAKVRAWFNEQQRAETIARGREAVERLLQREGRTALAFDDLAAQLQLSGAEALFEKVGKDELPLRQLEAVLRPSAPPPDPDAQALVRTHRRATATPSGVLVVGVDALMTQLARCCKPAPPDPIRGFVTRDKGVSVHRADCANFSRMASRSPGRVIDVAWASSGHGAAELYPVDVAVRASDRQGLLRDISDVFAKERMNVVGVQTQSVRGTAWMTFTIEVPGADRLDRVMAMVAAVEGVHTVRRR